MKDLKIAKYFLVLLLSAFIYLAFLTIRPFINGIIMGFVLALAFYPVYNFLAQKLKSKNFSSFIMILLVFLLIVVPGAFIGQALFKQSFAIYDSFKYMDSSSLNTPIPFMDGQTVGSALSDSLIHLQIFMVNNVPKFLSSIIETLLSLFVMLFVMYYAFRDGPEWVEKFQENMPLKKQYTKRLIDDTKKIIRSVLYGYLFIACLQGLIAGTLFFVLGIPNPVFWGFLILLFAVIPVLGSPIIWLPLGLYELAIGHVGTAIVLFLFGVFVLMSIENILKPKIIGMKARIHPALILLGVLGGLGVFGLIGIILGPLVLSLLTVMVKFFILEFN